MKYCKNRCVIYYKTRKWGCARECVYCHACEVWISKSEIDGQKRCKCCHSVFRYLYQDYSHQHRQKRLVYNIRVE